MSDGFDAVDVTTPSIARVYDYLLGGTDNHPVDRAVGDRFRTELPGSVAIAVTNRQALVRAVGEIARASGIGQFLDLGSGLPTADNVHQVARRHLPGARVVYVDHDPAVAAHARALLAGDERTAVVHADVRRPEEIRGHPDTTRLIDFSRPVAVILSAVLHHLDDEEDPAGIVRYWRDQVPSGSHVFVSHFRSGRDARTRALEATLQGSLGRGRWRTDEELRALFDGLEILPPGIVPAAVWRADAGHEPTVWEQLIVAALARKP